MPKRHPVYERAEWKKRGLRRMNAGSYAIFYIPDAGAETVSIIRVMYNGRNIENVLSGAKK